MPPQFLLQHPPPTGYFVSADEAGDAFDFAEERALCLAYEKQQERGKLQDTNLLTLIMLNLSKDSVNRLKFEYFPAPKSESPGLLS